MAKRRRRNGEGSVYYRRADGRWIGDITLGERRIVSAASSGDADELFAALRRASPLGLDASIRAVRPPPDIDEFFRHATPRSCNWRSLSVPAGNH